jgi:hypothetical protein
MFQSIFQKQYNADAAEVQSASSSIAELMAKSGVMNSTENPLAQAIQINKEQIEKPPATESTPVVTTNEDSQAVTANQETPTPEVKEQVAVTPQIEERPPVQPSWQEVLKQQPEDDVLKTLGLDASVVSLSKELKENQQMMAFFQHWKSNGDVQSYLKELSTDYTKMPAEEVMRHQLKQEYPKATPQQIEALYKREVVKAYSLDSEDEDEKL